ncbi:MAG: hypothetical protein ACFFC7_18885 [Candidatus Hermodarchaeota archaeon]
MMISKQISLLVGWYVLTGVFALVIHCLFIYSMDLSNPITTLATYWFIFLIWPFYTVVMTYIFGIGLPLHYSFFRYTPFVVLLLLAPVIAAIITWLLKQKFTVLH